MLSEYNDYVAEATLEIKEGAFYDQWRFMWGGEIVRATVGRDVPKITVLSDHPDQAYGEIHQFIKETMTRIDNEQIEYEFEDDFESRN
jgi:hypothetical protein